ncbi:hypothetical protein RFI_02194 [Reticulomyxa filosa]|uniref:Uncharacterized protein n=1 Tax=Reticulomyxa filosa TaxID=46433 RepID=X6P9W3_RETFI|nr:hypothetical protein RFI_02194 [Reticulomyxa filosa]|eukprot:ETO34893.1 hypothetical protein RFI_02194 [Reticulomyxa filosa]
MIKGNENEDGGIFSLTFLPLKNKENVSKKTDDSVCNVNLCYDTWKSKIFINLFILFNFDTMTTKYVKHSVKSILFFIDNLYLHNSVVSDKTAIIIENFSSLIYAREKLTILSNFVIICFCFFYKKNYTQLVEITKCCYENNTLSNYTRVHGRKNFFYILVPSKQ